MGGTVMAGDNIRVTVWRMSDSSDDRVGGAVITGSSVYTGVPARIEQEPANQLLAQQGLETLHMFKMRIIPGTITIYERDEIEVTHPFDHHYFGQRFRVNGVMYSSNSPRDPRNYIMLNLTRSDRYHRQQ
jgi:hypothetical protein